MSYFTHSLKGAASITLKTAEEARAHLTSMAESANYTDAVSEWIDYACIATPKITIGRGDETPADVWRYYPDDLI